MRHGLAAYLVTLGFELEIDYNVREQAHFVFEPEARKIAESYWTPGARVNPRVFANNLRDIKSRLIELKHAPWKN